MTLGVPRLPISLDPLIAEAKRRARVRRSLILFVLVVAGAAVAAALELRPASGSGSGAAAVGGRPVIHVVMQWPPSTSYFDLRTGRETDKTAGEVMWVDRQSDVHHIVSTEGGRHVADQLWKAHFGPATEAAAVTRFYLGLATTDYRLALLNGSVKLVGRGTFAGHRVDWLRVVSRRDRRYYVLRELGEVGIDAQTYKPLLLRSRSGKRYVYVRILQADAVPYNPANFKRHGPRQVPALREQLAPGYAFRTSGSSLPHGTVVRAPWLTAGPAVDGLELRSVTPFTIRKTKHRFYYGAPRPKAIHGLALVYAPASSDPAPAVPTPVNVYGRPRDARATTRFTTIYELPRAARTAPWSLVPSGSMEVQTGYTTLGDRVAPTPWIGYLRKRGLYITISTPQGPRFALKIARSLGPA